MGGSSKLMNEKMHVILEVEIAEFAIAMVEVFDLVRDHSSLRVETFEAVLVGTLDLHLDQYERSQRLGKIEGRRSLDMEMRRKPLFMKETRRTSRYGL